MNTIWERLEIHLQDNLQHLLLDYVNGAMNPITVLVMEWMVRRNSAVRRRVTVMHHLLDIASEQPLYQPSHAVLQRIRTRIKNQPPPYPQKQTTPSWTDHSIQVVLAILTLLIHWRTSG